MRHNNSLSAANPRARSSPASRPVGFHCARCSTATCVNVPKTRHNASTSSGITRSTCSSVAQAKDRASESTRASKPLYGTCSFSKHFPRRTTKPSHADARRRNSLTNADFPMPDRPNRNTVADSPRAHSVIRRSARPVPACGRPRCSTLGAAARSSPRYRPAAP